MIVSAVVIGVIDVVGAIVTYDAVGVVVIEVFVSLVVFDVVVGVVVTDVVVNVISAISSVINFGGIGVISAVFIGVISGKGIGRGIGIGIGSIGFFPPSLFLKIFTFNEQSARPGARAPCAPWLIRHRVEELEAEVAVVVAGWRWYESETI